MQTTQAASVRRGRHRGTVVGAWLTLVAVATLAGCVAPRNPPGDPQPFACDTSGATLTCSDPATGLSVVVPWQGRAVEVRRVPVAGFAVSTSALAFVLGRTVASFAVYEDGGGDLVTSFDPPIEVSVPYEAPDFTAAEPFVGERELALAAWDEIGDDWVPLGHGVFSQGYWVADPVLGSAFALAGQPRFELVGSAAGGSAIVGIAEVTGVVALAWGSVPWDPEHAIVAFDECTTLEGDVTCTSDAAGFTLWVPWQGEAVNVLSIPMNKASTLTPTAFEGSDVVSTRRVLNFVVERAAAPGEWIATFDPPFDFALEYLDEDVAAAFATGAEERLVVGYWHEELEELRVMGDGDSNVCEGDTEGCAWGQPVEALTFGYVENTDNPVGTRGGVAYGASDTWGDRLIMVGSR